MKHMRLESLRITQYTMYTVKSQKQKKYKFERCHISLNDIVFIY